MHILAAVDAHVATWVDLAAMLGLSVLMLNTIVSKQSEIEASYMHCGPLFSKECKSLKTLPLEENETIIFIINKTKAARNKNLLFFFVFPVFTLFLQGLRDDVNWRFHCVCTLHKMRPVTSHHLCGNYSCCYDNNVKCFCLFILIVNAV